MAGQRACSVLVWLRWSSLGFEAPTGCSHSSLLQHQELLVAREHRKVKVERKKEDAQESFIPESEQGALHACAACPTMCMLPGSGCRHVACIRFAQACCIGISCAACAPAALPTPLTRHPRAPTCCVPRTAPCSCSCRLRTQACQAHAPLHRPLPPPPPAQLHSMGADEVRHQLSCRAWSQ